MSTDELEKWSGRSKPGMPLFDGPQEVRDDFIRSMGFDFVGSYIDPASWIDKNRTMVMASGVAFDRINDRASKLCKHLGITVREGGGRIRVRNIQEAYESEQNQKQRPFAMRDAAE